MSTATGVATPNKPSTEDKDNSLEAAKALAELHGREEGDGDEKSTNAKNKKSDVDGNREVLDVSRENHESVDTGKGGVGGSESNIEYTDDKTNNSGTDLDAGNKVEGRDLTKSSDLYDSGKCNTFFLSLSCANFLSSTVFSYSEVADVSKQTR